MASIDAFLFQTIEGIIMKETKNDNDFLMILW